ncbi:MAG: protoporphyrinogen oxidase HemJ [Wenzhouxiangellaceae bacterium]
MLWLKAFHIIFLVTWFAGLFYLPRLFVYHAVEQNPATIERFKIMERRLLIMTHIGGALTIGFGLALLFWWATHSTGYFQQGWLHAKLTLVAGLIAYHAYCRVLVRRFAAGLNRRSDRWYRWFNEVPGLFLIAIVLLVVVKPF